MLHKSNVEKMEMSQFSGLVLGNVFEYGHKSYATRNKVMGYIFVAETIRIISVGLAWLAPNTMKSRNNGT